MAKGIGLYLINKQYPIANGLYVMKLEDGSIQLSTQRKTADSGELVLDPMMIINPVTAIRLTELLSIMFQHELRREV